MRYLLIASVFITALLVAGCASTRQYVPMPVVSGIDKSDSPEKALIYVMQKDRDNRLSVTISDDKQVIGQFGILKTDSWIPGRSYGRYLCWEREPGSIQVITRIKSPWFFMEDIIDRLEINLEKGQTYYVLLKPHFFSPHITLLLLPQGEGMAMLRECKPVKVDLGGGEGRFRF